MGVINLNDVQPGMVLAGDVKDRMGRTLLSGGNEVTEKHIRIFKMWGVTEADIKGVDHADVVARETAAVDPALLAKAEGETDILFQHAKSDHPALKELQRLATFRRVRQMAEENHGS